MLLYRLYFRRTKGGAIKCRLKAFQKSLRKTSSEKAEGLNFRDSSGKIFMRWVKNIISKW